MSLFTFSCNGFTIPQEIQPRAGCALSVNADIGSPPPLLIRPGSTAFVSASDTKGSLTFGVNENVLLACPGASNYFKVIFLCIILKYFRQQFFVLIYSNLDVGIWSS